MCFLLKLHREYSCGFSVGYGSKPICRWDKAGPLSVATLGSHENRARGSAVGSLGWKHIIMVVKLTVNFLG